MKKPKRSAQVLACCLLLIVGTVLIAWAQQPRPPQSGARPNSSNSRANERIPQFTQIHVRGAIDVEYRQTPNRRNISFSGSQDLVALVSTQVRQGCLHIGFKKEVRNMGKRRLKVIVSSPTLESVRVDGSGDFISKGTIRGNRLSVVASGSGDINCSNVLYNSITAALNGSGEIDLNGIRCNDVSMVVNGSGDIDTSGKVRIARLTVSGSGKIDAAKLIADNAEAAVAGSGKIQCFAVRSLKATTSGSGRIEYYGSPANKQLQGRVRKV